MSTLTPIYERVSRWNAARYERKFNRELTHKLLNEELTETLNSTNKVDYVDGCCDLIFVAMGAIWKLNITEAEEEFAQNEASNLLDTLMDTIMPLPVYLTTFSSAVALKAGNDLVNLYLILYTALYMLTVTFNDDHDKVLQAIAIVCDSNDTKSVTKCKPDEKYGTQGKGMTYISPEPRLAALLGEGNE